MLALFAFLNVADAASPSGRAGNSDRPKAPAVVQKTITVEVMTPDGAWELHLDEIRQVGGELWVFAKVERPEGAIGAMMQSAASDQVSGRFPEMPQKVFVVGKTWKWANEEPVQWLASNGDYAEKRRQGQRLWRR
jgi:hypothetical protein